MTRLAAGRDTHLEREEIAAETLRQFDQGVDPSIRQLASALKVTPSAIYHHFDSRADIVQAAVDLVWRDVLNESVAAIGNPFEADPLESLVTVGVFARRAFIQHYRIAPYMTSIPQSPELSSGGLAIFANVLERLGASGERAGEAFHQFSSYCFGSALYAANRLIVEVTLRPESLEHQELERLRGEAHLLETSSPETRQAIDEILDLSETNPERDEELFEMTLRQLLSSYRKD